MRFLPFLSLLVLVRPAWGCYSVVVGKGASADGSVIFGHDEQNWGRRVVNLRVVPRMRHGPGEVVRLLRGGVLPEVGETYSFIWSEIPGMEFSDTYINEWGVAVASNYCPTREDSYEELVARGEIVDGGIGYMLRRLVVQRARTAREGVRLAGELIEKFGYTDSGRTLVIADPNEAWLLSIVRGKHWVARRVPDDEVALLPNLHIICEVDLSDTNNFMGSPDIVDYAVRRGWFEPDEGRPFSFRRAYNRSDARDPRQELGQFLVTGRWPDPGLEGLPFSVKPARPLTVGDVVAILRDDRISNAWTQEASVFQLRGWMPPEVGCVYWRTSGDPRTGPLVPWYLGITGTPEPYYRPAEIHEQLTLSHHFDPPPETFRYDPDFAWWKFKRLQDIVHEDYEARIGPVRKVWEKFEEKVFAGQAEVEEEALRLFSEDPDSARAYLTRYSGSIALKAAELAGRMAEAIREGRPLDVGAEPGDGRPVSFRLLQNYPNPFNSRTTISYDLPEDSYVILEVFSLAGQLVATLVSAHQVAGHHEVVWDCRSLSSGVYICRLKAGKFVGTRVMVLLR
ncbi:MAG: hypothetical protein DRP99_02855 [Candidatus Latescibacterota bacterium]|nr:MAG: hypothetical protein DRP99_02855 [Candidatus Latescibacterota bacterium]